MSIMSPKRSLTRLKRKGDASSNPEEDRGSPTTSPMTRRAAARAAALDSLRRRIAGEASIFPPLVVDLIFQSLPAVAQAVTVSRTSKEWREWSKPRAAALKEALRQHRLSSLVKGGDTLQRIPDWAVPGWAVQEAWPRLSVLKRSALAVAAARHGDIETLAWMHETGFPLETHCDASLCDAAAYGGHTEMLQWLCADGGYSLESSAYVAAVRGGRLEVLQWLHANGCPLDASACAAAASGGNLEMLQWLHSHACPWDEKACNGAALNGRLDVLRWLHAKSCPWGKDTCAAAASNGGLDVLQWLHARGCPWTEWSCVCAAEHGHLQVLQWLVAHGCPLCQHACQVAARGGHLGVLQWLYANGCPFNSDKVAEEVEEQGHMHIKRWLTEAGMYPNWGNIDEPDA